MMKVRGSIVSLQIGKPKNQIFSGNSLTTAINRNKVSAIQVTNEAIDGDEVANKKYHGGPNRVICFYPYEHYEKWEKQLGTKLSIPALGENITVSGMKENEVYIGDIYKVGKCVIQISQGRTPCHTISAFNEQPQILKKLLETCLTGYFARILEPGIIKEDDEIILERRLQEDVTVLYASQVVLQGQDNLEGIDRVLSIPSLSTEWMELLSKKRNKYIQST